MARISGSSGSRASRTFWVSGPPRAREKSQLAPHSIGSAMIVSIGATGSIRPTTFTFGTKVCVVIWIIGTLSRRDGWEGGGVKEGSRQRAVPPPADAHHVEALALE